MVRYGNDTVKMQWEHSESVGRRLSIRARHTLHCWPNHPASPGGSTLGVPEKSLSSKVQAKDARRLKSEVWTNQMFMMKWGKAFTRHHSSNRKRESYKLLWLGTQLDKNEMRSKKGGKAPEPNGQGVQLAWSFVTQLEHLPNLLSTSSNAHLWRKQRLETDQ